MSDGITLLGAGETNYQYDDPSSTMLETFPNPSKCTDSSSYDITFTSKEFTSLCPITGQPDFAEIDITYVPDEKCVETKSLKMYLFAYRNYQGFMEKVINKIADDLQEVLQAKSLTVEGRFHPRGGIYPVISAYRGK